MLQPQYIAVKQAIDLEEQQIKQISVMLNGILFAQYPEGYISLDQAKKQIQSQAKDLSQLEQWNAQKNV